MGIAPETASFLRSQGHDAIHLFDQGLGRMLDSEIVEKARSEKRVILTHDHDFSQLIALSGAQLPSVITFRLANMRPESVNRYLIETLNRFAQELEQGALISVTEAQIRCRTLPIRETEGQEGNAAEAQ